MTVPSGSSGEHDAQCEAQYIAEATSWTPCGCAQRRVACRHGIHPADACDLCSRTIEGAVITSETEPSGSSGETDPRTDPGKGRRCWCHRDAMYYSLLTCPRCGHTSYDALAESCERRSCGFVGVELQDEESR